MMRTYFEEGYASMDYTRTFRRCRSALAVLPLLAVMTACGGITDLEQSNPGQILVRDAYVPANATLLVNGAIGDFECAFHRFVVAGGLMSDELANAWLHSSNYPFDQRDNLPNDVYGTSGCGGTQFPGVYTPLSVARTSADTILARLEEWTDEEVADRQTLIAQAAGYAGYSVLLLGEAMCSAALNIGPELTREQLWAEAVTRFDRAITAATAAGDADMLAFAHLGRARSLVNLGDLAGAAADAAQVPPGFVVNAVAGTGSGRVMNLVSVHLGPSGSSFSAVEGIWEGLTFEGVADPRVVVVNTGIIGGNGSTVLRQQTKYEAHDSPIPIARSAEARLIIAEHRVSTGDLSGAADIINELHAAAGLPEYDETGQSAAQVLDHVIQERARELFLEGHRFADANRYDLPFYPAVGEPFPNGGTYGDQRCFPLPDVERNNNPNIS